MTAITISLVVAGILAACTLLILSIYKNQNKYEERNLVEDFIESGEKLGLSFTLVERITNSIIGWDASLKKLMILSLDKENDSPRIYDHEDIRSASLIKQYRNYNLVQQSASPEQYVHKILVRIDAGGEIEDLLFYDSGTDSLLDVMQRSIKARNWNVMLRKNPVPLRKIA